MKSNSFIRSPITTWTWLRNGLLLLLGLCAVTLPVTAQEVEEEEEVVSVRPVRSTFESALIIDNQTVMVPIKGTFEFDIQHRFGTLDKGFDDLFGLYASSNIRLGFLYVPIDRLSVGFGLTKYKNLVDFNAKYALLKQHTGWRMPVSVTYYGNIAIDARKEDIRGEVYHESDRMSYFHQLIIARKFANWLSVQVAPSVSHFNLINKELNNDHFAVAVGVQVKLTDVLSIIANVDQPLTKHTAGNPSPNPNPNVSLGVQMSTSSHAFQVFIGNYGSIIPQENNVYYRYIGWENAFADFSKRFRIGFNVTRLWNY